MVYSQLDSTYFRVNTANEPWKNILISKIISVAFATGTYVSIFSMPWELSIQYSIVRFIILMLIAILGMTWLLYAHQLIESKTKSRVCIAIFIISLPYSHYLLLHF